jgi:hypothetical protein
MLPHQFIRIPIGRVRGRKNSFSLPAGTVKLSGLWLGETSAVGYRPSMTISRDPIQAIATRPIS